MRTYSYKIKVNNIEEAKNIENIWSKKTGFKKWNLSDFNVLPFPKYLYLLNPKKFENNEYGMKQTSTYYEDVGEVEGGVITPYKKFIDMFETTSKYVKQLNFESFINEIFEPGQGTNYDNVMGRIKKYGIFMYISNDGETERLFEELRKLGVHWRQTNDLENDGGYSNIIVNYHGEGFQEASRGGINKQAQVEIDNVDDFIDIVKNNIIKESYEPGQIPKENISELKTKIYVKIKNAKESRKIQDYLFSKDIFWSDGDDEYYDITKTKKYPTVFGITGEEFFFSLLKEHESLSFEEFEEKYME